jgi:hypothetical protein
VRFSKLEALTRESRVSDVVLALQGADANYLCHFLEDAMKDTCEYWRRDLYLRTSEWIMSFLKAVGGVYGSRSSALATYCERIAEFDGEPLRAPFAPGGSIRVQLQPWRTVRDKWCRDYAAFLKEFGL